MAKMCMHIMHLYACNADNVTSDIWFVEMRRG